MRTSKDKRADFFMIIVVLFFIIIAIGLFLIVCGILLYFKSIVVPILNLILYVLAAIGAYSLYDKEKNNLTQKISDFWKLIKSIAIKLSTKK